MYYFDEILVSFCLKIVQFVKKFKTLVMAPDVIKLAGMQFYLSSQVHCLNTNSTT